MDLANPIFHTTEEETKKTARRKMNHQWNLRGKGNAFALHLDNNMETIKHKNGMAYYLLHESSICARARARFRFNRVMTNTVRNRLHDRFNITNCTHPTCLEQSKVEDAVIRLGMIDHEDFTPYWIQHTREHVLLECPQYEDQREEMMAKIGFIRPDIPISMEMLLGCHIPSWKLSKHQYQGILRITGYYLIHVDNQLDMPITVAGIG